MTFGTLTVIVLAGLVGPLLSSSDRFLVPVVVGEIFAGLVLGKSGFGRLHVDDPTTVFLASVGFAMLMFAAGMHVPIRTPGLTARLGRGAVAAAVAGALAAVAGVVATRIVGVPHAAVYGVVLASGSAAVLVPSLQEGSLLDTPEGLTVAAQVAIADVAAIAVVPLALEPSHAAKATLGACAVAACAVGLYFLTRLLRDAQWIKSLRRLSKARAWALDLRVALVVLFGLSWLAVKAGASVLIAGFAVGLVVAATGGPKRLSRQVTGVAQGLFVPLFFVVLGARIDVRDLGTNGSLIELTGLLVAFNVAIHLTAAAATRQPVTAGLAATVQLGVPAAVATLGLQEGVITPGTAAAIVTAALLSLAVSGVGVALLARRQGVRRRSVTAPSARATSVEPIVTETSSAKRQP